MLNLLAWIVLIFRDVWWKCPKPNFPQRQAVSRRPEKKEKTFVVSDSSHSVKEVIRVEVVDEIEIDEADFKRINSYTESFGNVDDGEYLKKAYIVQRNDSRELDSQDQQNGRFIPECDMEEEDGGIVSEFANGVEGELEGAQKRTKVTINVNKKLKGKEDDVSVFTSHFPQARNYAFKIDLKVKRPREKERTESSISPTAKTTPEFRRTDSWESLEMQDAQEIHKIQDLDCTDKFTTLAGKSPDRMKSGGRQHLLQTKCESPKSEYQDFDIIMRKRKCQTDTVQKAGDAFGYFGHRDDKMFGSSPKENISTRWRKLQSAVKNKTYKETKK